MSTGTGDRTLLRPAVAGALLLALCSAAAPAPSPGPSAFAGAGLGPPHGAAATAAFEELGTLRWRFVAHGPVRGTPAVAGERVVFGTAAGHVHAVAAADGAEAWRHDAGSPVVSSPLVVGDRVFVSSRAALEALRLVDGAPLWRLDFGDELPLPWGREGWDYRISSPVHRDGRVFVGAGDGHVRAVDAADGEVLWRFDAGARVRPTPTIAGDLLYVGDSDGVFHALDVATGRERWRFVTEGHELGAAEAGFDRRQIYSSATVADGAVYFGSRDANLYALDAATGRLRWASDDGTSAWVIAAPAVRGDTVYETRSSSARVRALDVADGTERWSVQAQGAVFAAPVPSGEVVHVVDGAGTWTALEAATGRERWRYGLGDSAWAPPAVAGGRLYVGDDTGAVQAFEPGADPTPLLAVYWDDGLSERAGLGAAPRHEAIASWFSRRGYRRLDGEGLEAFLRRRIEDRRPSAVVFAMDAVPEPVVLGADPSLRAYLQAGGKAVWLGRLPALLELDDEGRAVGVDPGRPGELLGVDLAPFNSDVYRVRPTTPGRSWGLERWWTGGPQAAPGPGLTALAVDELGAISAWVRSYGGPEGSGFVSLYPTTDAGRLDEIRAVTEYGIFRSPVTREIEAR